MDEGSKVHQTSFPTAVMKQRIKNRNARQENEQRRAKNALREREEHLRAIDNNLPGVIYQFYARKNGELGMHYVSDRSVEILGLDSDPKDFFERITACLDPLDRQSMFTSIEKAVSLRGNWEFESRFVKPTGEVMYVRGISQPREYDDEIIFNGLLLDITEHRLAENALRESEKKYRALIETTGTGFLITDKKGKVIDANSEYVRLTGHQNLEEIRGRNALEWTADHAKEKTKEAVTKCFCDGFIRGLEIDFSDTKGNITPVEINATRVELGGKQRVISLCRDITERKRVEKNLRSLNRQLENIIEFLPDATFIMDRDKRIIAWNRAIEKMTGIPKGDILGKDHSYSTIPFYGEKRPYIMDLLEKDSDETESKYDFVKKRGNSIFAEAFTPALNNGKGAYIWAVASPLYDDEGTVIGAIESIRDISDNKQAAESLRQSEGKYRHITEKINDIIWTSDMNFCLTYDSPSVKKVLGYTPDERIHTKATDILTPDSYNRVLETVSRELQFDKEDGVDPTRAITLELEHYHKDGTIRWLESVVSAIRDNKGNPIGIHGVSRDITYRKKAEEALKESHNRIERQMLFSQAMLSAIPIPVFFKDTRGRFLGCNQAFSDQLGLTQDQIMGKTVSEFWPDDLTRQYQERDLELIGKPGCLVYEGNVRDKAGNIRHVIFSKDVFRNENGEVAGIVGAYIDITERRMAENELKKHRDKLEEMVKERTTDLRKTYEQLKQENEARKTTESALRAQEIELEQKQLSLQETNTALRVLLQKRNEDKTNIEETIMTNIKTSVFPFIEKLKKSGLREAQSAYLSEIELHLREIASSYIKKLSSDHLSLSPTEIQVATLIKEGKSSKEIAELLNVSLNTILTHRFCIRRKTGLIGRKVNLTSYLQTLT